MTGLSVVLPTLNEADNLATLLPAIADVLVSAPFRKRPTEIIVVDDASEDGSAALAESVRSHLSVPLRVVRRNGTRSLGCSVVDGAHQARFKVVLVMDADRSHAPEDVAAVARPVLEGTCDLSIGSRYVPGGQVSPWPMARRVLSSLGTFTARRLTSVRDPLSGFFATRRSLLTGALPLRPRGYKILLEVLGRARGLHITEVPIRFSDRACGRSKLQTKQLLEFLVQLVSLALTPGRRPDVKTLKTSEISNA